MGADGVHTRSHPAWVAAGHLDVAALLDAAGCDTTPVLWPAQQEDQANVTAGTDVPDATQDFASDTEAGMVIVPQPAETSTRAEGANVH